MTYLTLIFRTIVLFVLLLLFIRFMGKREVGELSIFDLGVFFVMSELITISIANLKLTLLHSLVPILTIVIMQKVFAKLSLKSEKFRKIVDGEGVILIERGKINQKEMKKLNYNLDDLLMQLHEKGYDTTSDVKFAILETDGKLSIIDKQSKVFYPFPLVKDGVMDYKLLKYLKVDENKLVKELMKRNYSSYKEIFLLILLDDDLYIERRYFFK